MALGAESRIGDLEEPVVNRTVRLMAVGTTLKDWRMLMKEGPSSLRMAGITVLVHAGLFEL
jgi:hypothetical protein